MARDYKNAQPKKTTRKKSTKKTKKKTSKKVARVRKTTDAKKGIPAWFWFLGGMLAMFVFFQSKSLLNTDIVENETTTEVEPYTSRTDINEVSDIPAEPSDSESESENEESKPTKEIIEIKRDPRFTFYEQLPKNEVIIPQEALEIEVDENKVENKKPLEAVTKAGSYILQTGSFKDFGDADRRKAELALLGLQTSIQKVAINQVNWYRVRVGPFSDLEKLNETRQDLRSGGVDALVIRVK